MKIPIPYSLSSLVRSVVRPRELQNPFTKVAGRQFVRNPNPFLEGRRLMHTITMADEIPRFFVGLHVGRKQVGVCSLDSAQGIIVPMHAPLDHKEGKDIISVAEQLKIITDELKSCWLVVGHYPWSTEEEQAESDLIVGAAKVECFMEELHNTRMLDNVGYDYHDVRVVLSQSGIRKRIQQLDPGDERFFGKSEAQLLEEFCEIYAAQFVLMHLLDMHGCSSIGHLVRGFIAVQRVGEVLTFEFNHIYPGKAFPGPDIS